MSDKTTHFGFQTVDEQLKQKKVAEVFSSVAQKYDVMNDLMSFGLHRVWKHFTIQVSGVREGDRVLDVAGGTADLSLAFARKVGRTGQVWLTDGPLAEIKEQLIQLFFIKARDLNEAIQVASKMPQARTGPIEVRPVIELDRSSKSN